MLLIGKPPINGPFSMAMLNNQRVYVVDLGMRGGIGHPTEVDLDKVDKLQQPHVATSLETMLIKESSPNA